MNAKRMTAAVAGALVAGVVLGSVVSGLRGHRRPRHRPPRPACRRMRSRRASTRRRDARQRRAHARRRRQAHRHSAADVQTKRAAGKTFAQIAAEKNVSSAAVVAEALKVRTVPARREGRGRHHHAGAGRRGAREHEDPPHRPRRHRERRLRRLGRRRGRRQGRRRGLAAWAAGAVGWRRCELHHRRAVATSRIRSKGGRRRRLPFAALVPASWDT